jgi:hypothetical protein
LATRELFLATRSVLKLSNASGDVWKRCAAVLAGAVLVYLFVKLGGRE